MQTRAHLYFHIIYIDSPLISHHSSELSLTLNVYCYTHYESLRNQIALALVGFMSLVLHILGERLGQEYEYIPYPYGMSTVFSVLNLLVIYV